jgi:hypothetical protein
MPTRAEASRIEGAKSRGPTTAPGRRAAALHAVKHGLTAETVVLRSGKEYEGPLRDYLEPFDPANSRSGPQARCAPWRRACYAGVETTRLDLEVEEQHRRVTERWTDVAERTRLA